ncbi:MAG TPA: MBL fold metallo-hydrolase [Rhizomicrobium sp.]|jgi:hypothetical protein
MKITFVNHASVKIASGNVCVLTDPWTEGPVFNNGWDLLVPTPLTKAEVMAGVTHIWVSHEHPDHFSPGYFSSIAAEYRDKIEVLFQKTRDRRVAKFLESKGFRLREAAPGEPLGLGGGVTGRIYPSDFYDSWIQITDGETNLVNLNDCDITQAADLAKVRAITGGPDVLLSQYSYAAWKGGRENVAFRKAAAAQKLETVKTQIRALSPRKVIPFASMVYFSSVENSYLNDSVNTPDDAAAAIREAGAEPIVLFPGDAWDTGTAYDNEPALARYRAAYAGLAQLPLRDPGKGKSFDELKESFDKYRKRVGEKNSLAFIGLARRLPAMGAFRPVTIRLTDLNETVEVGLVDGFKRSDAKQWDAAMHSNSLAMILDQEFGYDTLTVNGRFEATAEGFSKLTRSFAIGSLNAMGLSFGPSLMLQARIVAILMRRLRGVVRRLDRKAA